MVNEDVILPVCGENAEDQFAERASSSLSKPVLLDLVETTNLMIKIIVTGAIHKLLHFRSYVPAYFVFV